MQTVRVRIILSAIRAALHLARPPWWSIRPRSPLRLLGIAPCVVLAGCSLFASPRENPVIEERITDWGLQKVGVLATTAERRAVIVKVPERLLCAEPPPDVGEAVASAFSAFLEAKGNDLPLEAKGGASAALSTAITQLSYRTQGLQLYRDGSFFLCNMYMNQVIDAATYTMLREQLLTESVALIKQEIPLMVELRKQPLGSATAPGAAASTPGGSASAPAGMPAKP